MVLRSDMVRSRRPGGWVAVSPGGRRGPDRPCVEEVAHATHHLLESLVTSAPPKDRETFAAKQRERAAKRYAST